MKIFNKRYTRHLTWMMVLGVFFSCALFLTNSALANDDPLTQVQTSVDSIIGILQDEQLASPEKRAERRQKVEDQVDALFNFQEMGKRTLGAAWDKATPDEKKEFVDLFASMVKARYIGKIDEYSGQKVSFKKQVVKKKSAIVYSILLNNGTEVPIDYKLVLRNAKWMGYDMRIENVSLVANYRRDFQSIIKKGKMSGLLEKMREKVEKIQSRS